VPEEGGLVDALPSDEHKYLMVGRDVAHPRGHHRNQPFVESPIERTSQRPLLLPPRGLH